MFTAKNFNRGMNAPNSLLYPRSRSLLETQVIVENAMVMQDVEIIAIRRRIYVQRKVPDIPKQTDRDL